MEGKKKEGRSFWLLSIPFPSFILFFPFQCASQGYVLFRWQQHFPLHLPCCLNVKQKPPTTALTVFFTPWGNYVDAHAPTYHHPRTRALVHVLARAVFFVWGGKVVLVVHMPSVATLNWVTRRGKFSILFAFWLQQFRCISNHGLPDRCNGTGWFTQQQQLLDARFALFPLVSLQ